MSIIYTDNFKKIIEAEEVIWDKAALDVRHNMVSANCTVDLDAYLNYMERVKEFAIESKYSDLLSLGFLPLVMPPSFFGGYVHELVEPKLTIRAYHHYAFSFRGNRYTSDYADIWVHKSDAAEIVDKPLHAITVRDVVRAIGL
jgi:hypothetical protein